LKFFLKKKRERRRGGRETTKFKSNNDELTEYKLLRAFVSFRLDS
jgi:hypothetical protein